MLLLLVDGADVVSLFRRFGGNDKLWMLLVRPSVGVSVTDSCGGYGGIVVIIMGLNKIGI